jgi:hypothetical protein
MKQRAKELDVQRRAQRTGGSKSYGSGSSTGISSNMYSNSSTDNKPDITPTPITYASTSSSYVLINSSNKMRFDSCNC